MFERLSVVQVAFMLQIIDRKTANAADRAGEVRIDELARKTDRFEDLCGMVALHGRDTHLRHDRNDAREDGGIVVRDARFGIDRKHAALG